MRSESWRFLAFGRPRMLNASGQTVRSDPRALALFAYLAIEGSSSRARLAGLLWPDVVESTARNNLVHLLRRIQRSHHPELLHADENIAFGDMLTSDVTPWGTGQAEDADVPSGVLLDGLLLGDQPELDEWLLIWRERLDAARARTLARRSAAAEEAADLELALVLTQRRLDIDPLSEDAWRTLMRQHYLSGDRPAALRAYHRCRDLLRRELDVEPLPETVELARLIDQGRVALPAPTARVLPLAVRRPPVLVGRQDTWQRMEDAWNAGQGIVLSGDPGVGKTRLAHDFLAEHGGGMRFEGRPGDAGLSYASQARTLRQVVAALPGSVLPLWVREELSRVLPELAEAGAVALPITNDEQRLRFWRAIGEVLGTAMRAGLTRFVFDDVQFMDEASVESGTFAFSQLGWGQPDAPCRTIHTVRRGEVPSGIAALLGQLADAGLMTVIELEPLEEGAISELVGQLELTGAGIDPDTLSSQLSALSGGNPLLVLEAARSLHERSSDDGRLPVDSVVSERAGTLMTSRLRRLSTSALHAARAAATLASDFDLELVAETLRAPVLEVAAAWEELDAAQIVTGEHFTHDLLAEALRRDTPEGVRRLLHRAAARALTTRGEQVPPGRVAQHWQAGGDGAQAAPWLVRAGRAAWHTGRFNDAAETLEQAAHLSAPTDSDAAFEALALRAEVLADMDDARHARAVQDLHERAVTPLQRATAHMHTYRGLEGSLDVSAIEPVIQAGLEALRVAEPTPAAWLVEAQLTEGQALLAFIRADTPAALSHLQWMARLGERAHAVEWQAKAAEGIGMAQTALAPVDARRYLEQAEALHLQRRDYLRAGSTMAKLARLLAEIGDLPAAQQAVNRGAHHLDRLDASHAVRIAFEFAEIMTAQVAGDLRGAQSIYTRATAIHDLTHSALLGYFHVLQAKTLRLQGHHDAAWSMLQQTYDGRPFPVHWEASRSLEAAEIQLSRRRFDGAGISLATVEADLQARPHVIWQARWHELSARLPGSSAPADHLHAARRLRAEHHVQERHWSALE